MDFRCEAVRERKEGTLEAAGVRWTEARIWAERSVLAVAIVLFVFSFFLGGMGLLLGATGVGLPFSVLVGPVLFGVGYLVREQAWGMDGIEREWTFWRDGKVRAPLGLWWGRLPNGESQFPHTDIVSIEAVQVVRPKPDEPTMVYTHGVRVFYKSGEVNNIARRLRPDEAHMVAVRLTQALRELRTDMATSWRRTGKPKAERAAARVID